MWFQVDCVHLMYRYRCWPENTTLQSFWLKHKITMNISCRLRNIQVTHTHRKSQRECDTARNWFSAHKVWHWKMHSGILLRLIDLLTAIPLTSSRTISGPSWTKKNRKNTDTYISTEEIYTGLLLIPFRRSSCYSKRLYRLLTRIWAIQEIVYRSVRWSLMVLK